MDQHGISKLNLKRQNRMQVLNILKQQGPISRIDIAAALKLTRAAVTIITNEMIEQGVLHEIGEMQYINEKIPKGRKKILIDINHNYKFSLGALIEDNQVSVGLSNISGEVLDKKYLSFEKEINASTIIDFIENSGKEILANNCLSDENVLGFGIGIIPSMHKTLGITVDDDGNADYSHIAKALETNTSIPVIIDNSIKALALANIDYQKIKSINQHNFVFIQFGDSFNFINVNSNEPQASNVNYTYLINKMIVNPNGEKVDNYPQGSVISELTNHALLTKVKRIYSKENTPELFALTEGNIENITLELCEEAANRHDDNIHEIFFTATKYIAILIHNLICSESPQKIVLHNFFSSEEKFEVFKNELNKTSCPEVADIIEMSFIDDKQGFLGGCALVTRQLFYRQGGYDRA